MVKENEVINMLEDKFNSLTIDELDKLKNLFRISIYLKNMICILTYKLINGRFLNWGNGVSPIESTLYTI